MGEAMQRRHTVFLLRHHPRQPSSAITSLAETVQDPHGLGALILLAAKPLNYLAKALGRTGIGASRGTGHVGSMA